jgi:hypothetical protein
MISAECCRKRRLFPLIPAVSAPYYDGTGQKNIRKIEAVFPPKFSRIETGSVRLFSVTGKKTEPLIFRRITIEISQYPSGIDRKQEHIRESTSHPRLFLAFHQEFPRNLTRIPPRFQ